MPIRDFPFLEPWSDSTLNVWLRIRVINPISNVYQDTYGLIDTGASCCAIPGFIAESVGYQINQGRCMACQTGSGITDSFEHNIAIEIFGLNNEHIHVIGPTQMHVMENLPFVLLGVNQFLENFNLHIDYPGRMFSVKMSS